MAERVTVPDMMNAREARAQVQRTLLARYPGAAVVCLCMNIACQADGEHRAGVRVGRGAGESGACAV